MKVLWNYCLYRSASQDHQH